MTKPDMDPKKLVPHSRFWTGWEHGMVALHYGDGHEKELLVDHAAADMLNEEGREIQLKVAMHPSNVGYLLEMVEKAWDGISDRVTVSRATVTVDIGGDLQVFEGVDFITGNANLVHSLCEALGAAVGAVYRMAVARHKQGWVTFSSIRGMVEKADGAVMQVPYPVWKDMRKLEAKS